MKPLDPRLLRYARAARGVFAAGAALGLARTAAIIAWCWALAHALAALALPVLGGAGGASGRIGEGDPGVAALPLLVGCALAALAVRAATGWGMDAVAARGAVRVKSQLRRAALDAIDARSPEWVAARSGTRLATVLGRGLDALDGYFSGYVPQLILTAVSTPLLVLAVLLADPVSGITVLIVFPVIPIFMILIGLATQAVQDRQWAQLQRLASSFLDVVSGLATLRIFRREGRQVERIARETEEYRSRTMKVLRVTFLSGFVLDLAGTFSIALVAVTVGTRLVQGEFPLALGLFVLLLLPEVFIPIRQVGAAFHASTEGLSASAEAFEIIDDGADEASAAAVPAVPALSLDRRGGTAPAGGALVQRGVRSAPTGIAPAPTGIAPAPTGIAPASSGIAFDEAVVVRGGRRVAGPVSFAVAPGELVALTGPSGAGKSTLVSALLGFTALETGSLARPEQLAWVGQRPGLLQGTVNENVALGEDPARIDAVLVRRALDAVGLRGIDPGRALGAAGAGLSGGQAQRLSVARGLYRSWSRGADAVVMDEPSSALDAESEALVAAALRREAHVGRAVLVISHRQALIESADRVVRLEAPQTRASHSETAQSVGTGAAR